MCYRCNKNGHYSDFCPDATEGKQMHMDAHEIVTLETPKAVRDEVGDEVDETP